MSRDGPMVLLTGGSVMAGLLTGVVLVQSAFEEPTQEAEQALAICRWKLLPPTENLPARGRGGTLTTACADILGLLPGPIQLRPSAAAPPRQPIAAVRALRSWAPAGARSRTLSQGYYGWVVERSFAWASRFRRLAKDYERLPETLIGLHFVAFVCLLLQKAAPLLQVHNRL